MTLSFAEFNLVFFLLLGLGKMLDSLIKEDVGVNSGNGRPPMPT